ncbi:hypothetical protein BmR1_04g08157 [Babesia microti strain RI]|uniref:Brl1/Brr6 domain-containing protein n=1 Tax=Babesia microti (strain RI) TaxID=1133968 RepID=I7ISR4_BABMR|nr:hypothetical protein BmR1_04g08157 [Babesia microti strain RI]CCF75816.1 hypothetical protein BmR1_04g08157 [Babesia microti strain RI]|eukprot:XP_012650224.1 hypothetical protein BmR1_04g08157 [Babesia microti strain RI]
MEDTLDSLRILQLRDLNAGNSKIRSDSDDSDGSCVWIGHKVDIKKEKFGTEGTPTGWLVQNVKNKVKRLSLATKNVSGNTVKLNYHGHNSAISPVNLDSSTSSTATTRQSTYFNSNDRYNFCNKDSTIDQQVQPLINGCKKLIKKSNHPSTGCVDELLRLPRWKYRSDTSRKPWYSRPATVNKWLRTLVNSGIALLFLLMIGFMAKHIHEDFMTRLGERESRNKILMKECESQYIANKCKINTVPYMINQCEEWELCMQGQHLGKQSSSLYAKLLAEVLNSFFSTLEYRTVCFLIVLTFVFVVSGTMCAWGR